MSTPLHPPAHPHHLHHRQVLFIQHRKLNAWILGKDSFHLFFASFFARLIQWQILVKCIFPPFWALNGNRRVRMRKAIQSMFISNFIRHTPSRRELSFGLITPNDDSRRGKCVLSSDAKKGRQKWMKWKNFWEEFHNWWAHQKQNGCGTMVGLETEVASRKQFPLGLIKSKSFTCAQLRRVHTRLLHGHNRKEGCKRRKDLSFYYSKADRPGKNN